MKLKELTLEDCERVRQWRNNCLESLRTPFLLTKEMQEQFYRDIICNRNARARYWGVWIEYGGESCRADEFIGMIGLENIEWENRRAEISIILNPEYRGKGYGERAVDLLLEQGFMYLNMENIWGECYENNPAIDFWMKITNKYNSGRIPQWLDCTKYYAGKYWDSLWFNIERTEWINGKNDSLKPETIIIDDVIGEENKNVKNNT
jgi:RimJ/RimL family protein N-acetyltransferase